MTLSLALSLAFLAQPQSMMLRHGPWEGRCYRAGHLSGMDHELCQVRMPMRRSVSGVEIERLAEGISVRSWPPGQCDRDRRAFLPASAFAGRDRAAVVTAFVRLQIETQLTFCRPVSRAPRIREGDISAVLRASDGLAPGSFLQLDPAVRAPAAAVCGRQLASDWKAAIARHPSREEGHVRSMMYTMSESGPRRARSRFEARPELMELIFAIGTGPGGTMILARKDARSWRDAPDEWFVALCDTAIEAWSGFVELVLYDGPDDRSPAFSVRAPTGVAAMDGYAIWSR